jgi:hypothetical protein
MNALEWYGYLGIQYWFYYPYHDCPTGNTHVHDWWYFWLVYDTENYEPLWCYYDFHHNVRWLTDWDDIEKDNFHPKVWVDAGGHRALFKFPASKWDTEWALFWAGGDTDVLFNDRDTEYAFGLMMIYLTMPSHDIAGWRDSNQDFNTGQTLKVEEFPYWVYVYDYSTEIYDPDGDGTEDKDSLNQRVREVHYVGNNIYVGDEMYLWPSFEVDGTPTKLPWMETDHDNNVYEAWSWIEYDYQEMGQKVWRHNEYRETYD